MRFESRSRYEGTADEVATALLDDRYLDFLLKHHGVLLEVQLLDKKEEGGKVRRKVRYRPRPVIEAIGPRKVPPEYFAFVEESVWDPATKVMSFTNTATTATISKMLVNTGTLRLRDVGGKCERIMEGEIALKLPFFLKPLGMIGEQVIHREGLKILDNEVPVMNRFLAEVMRSGS